MGLLEFIDLHVPALEEDQARHNLILGLLSAAKVRTEGQLRFWTLGHAGQCAIKTPGRSIVLGDPTELQCHRLAEETATLDYPGVLGPDETATWFVERARELRLRFQGSISQRIFAINEALIFPAAPGQARQVEPRDANLLADWMTDFVREATPHDPLPSKEDLKARAGQGQHWLWTMDDRPVSLAGISRRTRDSAAIAAVYTPPPYRNQGFAGAVVATVVERIFAEGRKTACLYTDLANPASNRCYAKVGFKAVCDSRLYLRDAR